MTRIYFRKYKVVWENIKSLPIGEECKIVTHPALHARFIKAIIKEKDFDLGYKMINAEKFLRMKLEYRSEGSTVIFKLRQELDLSNINLKALS